MKKMELVLMSSKSFIFLYAASLFFFTSCKGKQSAGSPPLNAILLTEDNVFPYIPTETVKNIAYSLINKSDETIKITSVTPTCQCTSYLLSQSVINPKSSGNITLQVNSGNRIGLKTTKAIITYQCQNKEYYQDLPVSFKVNRVINVQPETINYGALSTRDVPLSKTSTIQIVDVQHEVKDIKLSSSIANIVQLKNDNGVYQYSVTINPKNQSSGAFIEQIKIQYVFCGKKITNAEGPYIQGEIIGDIHFSPFSIYLGKLKKGTKINFSIHIIKRDNISKLLSSTSTGNVIYIDNSYLDENYNVNFQGKIGSDISTGGFKSTVSSTFLTTDGKTISLTFPIFGYIDQKLNSE